MKWSTVAVVRSVESHAAECTVGLTYAFGSPTFVVGGDGGVHDTYLSALFRPLEAILFLRDGDAVGRATVLRTPSKTAGIGYIDVAFDDSDVTPEEGDHIAFDDSPDWASAPAGTDDVEWT